jgi:hypothetical protein
MRGAFNSCVRGVAAVAVIVALSSSVFAAPPENRERERGRDRGSIVKIIKKIVRSLGDGLTIPRP